MSFMTIKLRYIVEQALDDKLLDHTEANWERIYPELGLSDYPIWSDGDITTGACEERTRLNNKIIRHFYMREIGLETVALFTWYLRDAMLNVMPYYNELYRSAALITDPMKEYEESMAEGHEEQRDTDEQRNGNSQTDTHSTYSDENIFSATPENMIPSGAVKNLRYATNVTYDNSNTSEGVTGMTRDELERGENTTYTGKRARYGRNSSQMELVRAYRSQIRNIDFELLHDPEIDSCFMGVWE